MSLLAARRSPLQARSLAWAGYAASAWAIAYAVLVRGYQELGGTLGLSGTFEDPEAMRRASLIAGAGILMVGRGVLVTLGALHHHRRTGGSASMERRLVVATVVAALVLTAFSCSLVVARSA